MIFGFNLVIFVAALTSSCWDCCNRSFYRVCLAEWKREGVGVQTKLFLIITYSLQWPKCLCHCTAQYVVGQAGLKAARRSLQDGGRVNITICIIVFNNWLEKGHWHWTDTLQLHFLFCFAFCFRDCYRYLSLFFSPPSFSFFKLWLPGWALSLEGPLEE